MTGPAPQQAAGQPPTEQQKDGRADDLAWLAALLVLRHQEEQNRIAALVVARMLPLWGLLEFADLAGSQRAWIDAVLPIVQAGYEQSQRAAQQFVIDYRHAKLPAAPEVEAITGRRIDGAEVIRDAVTESRTLAGESIDRFDEILRDLLSRPNTSTGSDGADLGIPDVRTDTGAPEQAPVDRGGRGVVAQVLSDTAFDARRAAASLLGTGPGEVQKRMPAPESEAMSAGRLLSAQVATRITTDGGRAVVQRAVELDDDAIGWARVLNVNPCAFCAILASRGAAYKRDSFKNSDPRFTDGAVKGVVKVHDGCRCGLRPVYNAADFHDSTAANLYAQWRNLPGAGTRRKEKTETVAEHRRAQFNAFRRQFVLPDPPPAPRVDLHSLIATRARLLDEGLAETSDQVRWIDNQIARFGALIDTSYTPGAAAAAARTGARRARATAAVTTGGSETPAQVASRHLPNLRTSLRNLLARGLDEDAPQVMWHRKQIARLSAALH